MKTVGKQLQDARLAKGWSPELAARETKIRVDRLHDLEADDFSNFSSPTYARGFVRTYARALGIDEYKILRQLDNKLPEDDNASFANDTGVPYMPEASKVAKPFEVGRGVYIAAGVGISMLLLIGFILVQTYRAGYFAEAAPAPLANPATNSLPAVAESDTSARAMPADSNAPPVALPVDPNAAAAAPAAPVAPVATPSAGASTAATTLAAADTNAAPRALPVDPAALAAATNAAPTVPAVVPAATANTTAVPAENPAVAAPASSQPASAPNTTTAAAAQPGGTTPIDTTTPPRAQAVDLNALNGATPAPSAPATRTDVPVASTPAPAPTPPPAPTLSARQADERPRAAVAIVPVSAGVPDATPVATPVVAPVADPATVPPADATTSSVPVVPANSPAPPTGQPLGAQTLDTAAPPLATTQEPTPDAAATAPSSLAPAASPETAPASVPVAPDSASALTGTTSTTPGGDGASAATDASAPAPSPADKYRGKRLVLTASHDSFVRVVALKPDGQQVLYSSMLHSGESISFNARKYSINVGDPSAIDIALDGINYGPHSEHSEPDTFTVESRQP